MPGLVRTHAELPAQTDIRTAPCHSGRFLYPREVAGDDFLLITGTQFELIAAQAAALTGSPNTRRVYLNLLTGYRVWMSAQDNTAWSQFGVASARRFVATLPATRQTQMIAALRKFLQTALDCGHHVPDEVATCARYMKPAVRKPRNQPVDRCLSQSELTRWLQAINLRRSDSSLWLRNAALIGMLIACGLRREEVTAIKESDLSSAGGRYVVNVPKNGHKVRIVPIPGWAWVWIADWLRCLPGHPAERRHLPVFRRKGDAGVPTKPLNGETVRRAITWVWNATAADAQLTGEALRPHDLRRTWAVLGLGNGAY